MPSHEYRFTFAVLPAHCEPKNSILLWISSTFFTCIPTPLALLSVIFGICSIFCWLFAQIPQIITNHRLRHTKGLSFYFLFQWLIGDLMNLVGATLTMQAAWQIVLEVYYVTVDSALIMQYFWYNHLKGRLEGTKATYRTIDAEDSDFAITEHVEEDSEDAPLLDERRQRWEDQTNCSGDIQSQMQPATFVVPHGAKPSGNSKLRNFLSAMIQFSPASTTMLSDSSPTNDSSVLIGRIFSWPAHLFFMGSRFPIIWKNYKRKSTAGLNPLMFLGAFWGNCFYCLGVLTNPCAWSDFPPFGGNGWVGAHGNRRTEWLGLVAPFLLGSAGVALLDVCIGIQFFYYLRNENLEHMN